MTRFFRLVCIVMGLGFCVARTRAATGDAAPAGSTWIFPDSASKVEIPLKRASDFLLLPIIVNGKPVGDAVLDTGTKALVLDETVVKDLGLKNAGRVDVTAMDSSSPMDICSVRSLTLGPARLERTFALNETKLDDFAHILGVERLAGIVGIAALPKCFAIDPRAGTLTLYAGKITDVPQGPWSPLRITHGMPEVRVTLRGDTWGWFLTDTGFEYDLAWTFNFTSQHHELLDFVPGQPVLRSDLHGIRYYLGFLFNGAEIFGTPIPAARLQVATTSQQSLSDEGAGEVGMAALRRFHLYFDLTEKRILALPYQDLSLPEWDSPGFDVHAADLAGTTPLMRAAADGLVARMPEFIGAGELDRTDHRGNRTALMYAAENGQVAAIDLLLKAGAKVNLKSDTGNTALLFAINSGAEDAALHILEAGPDLQIANAQGDTALSLAARAGSTRLVNEMLKKGADPNGPRDHYSALHYAAIRGNKEMITVLFEARAQIDLPGVDGKTPLMFACEYGRSDAAASLLDAGADIQARSATGDRALAYVAAESGDEATVRLLLKRGAKVDAINRAGQTAFDAAVVKGHTDILAILYDWKAK